MDISKRFCCKIKEREMWQLVRREVTLEVGFGVFLFFFHSREEKQLHAGNDDSRNQKEEEF